MVILLAVLLGFALGALFGGVGGFFTGSMTVAYLVSQQETTLSASGRVVLQAELIDD